MTQHLHDGRVGYKMTYFGTSFGKLGSCIGKSIILLFLISTRGKFALLQQNSTTDFSIGFRPMLEPILMAPAWRLHSNLYKFWGKASPHVLYTKNCCDLNLGDSLCIVTFFLFSDSGLNVLNGLDIYSDLF